MKALALALLLVLAVAVPVSAGTKLTAEVTKDVDPVHHGDLVTFTAVTDGTFAWRFDVRCYYGDELVLAGGGIIKPGSRSETMALYSPSSTSVYEADPDAVLECSAGVLAYLPQGRYGHRTVEVDGALLFQIIP